MIFVAISVVTINSLTAIRNNIFSNAIATTNNVSDNANSLGIHGININRNGLVLA